MDFPHTNCEKQSAQHQGGFTLIELLVVVAILGVLAAIAMQSFGLYRQRAYDAQAIHDLGNAAVAEEAYYAGFFSYVDVGPISGGTSGVNVSIPGFAVSPSVTIQIIARPDGFSGTATSDRGTGHTFTYDSDTDTMVAD